MLIKEDLSIEELDTNAHHWDIKSLSTDNNQTVLMYGFNAAINKDFQLQCKDYTRKLYFNNWAPCEFCHIDVMGGLNAFEYDLFFDEIYSICPYTVKWLNSMYGVDRYKYIFYPFNKRYISPNKVKSYDVIYHGNIHCQEHIDCLEVISKFNHRYISQRNNQYSKYITDQNIPYREKLNKIAQSKISVCYNFCPIRPQDINPIQSYQSWNTNEAFSEVGKKNIFPQFKGARMHEAAISKTLNLVYRDRWNVVEDWYTPDKEFIYFDNKQDLENKIQDILGNWDDYQYIINNAYNRAMKYTTDEFIKEIQ